MMRVHISDFARQQILETASYIQREFGKWYRDNFMQKVRETKLLLAANPQLGPVEPSLSILPKTYRSIVVARLNKMVYYIEGDVIEVSDFWNCRQSPERLSDRIK